MLRTHGLTDNMKIILPPTNTVCGGYNYDGLESLLLHNKILGKKILKRFYHILAWWPSWSCDQHHINTFSFPCTLKLTYEVWSKMAQWFL